MRANRQNYAPCFNIIDFVVIRSYIERICIYVIYFTFSLISVVINHATSFKQTYSVFAHFLEYLLLFFGDNVDERSE